MTLSTILTKTFAPQRTRPANRSAIPCRRRGAAAVEFALIAPLFLLLLAGIIEFGQAFRIQHAVSNASRRGARLAAMEGATSSQVEQQIKEHGARTLQVDPSAVAVGIAVNGQAGASLADAETGAEISVTVSIPYSEAGVGFFAHMLTNTTLSSTCTLERE